MENMSILVVEDEVNIARVVKLELEYEGYQVTTVHDGLEAWQLMTDKDQQFHLFILDVMLPGLSGMELLRRIRREENTTPVLMLTARDAIVDKVTGLDQGADDYMTKPFEIEELLARIRVLVRRSQLTQKPVEEEPKDELLTFMDIEVNVDRHEVKREEQAIDLTPREFDLLVYLIQNKQRVLTREQLLDRVWGFDYIGETNVVDVYIRYLRQKIDKPFEEAYIQTVRGVGYVMKEPTA
ncbi:response regulator transcription factor [Paenalkalicoccus suaedae]|uniref:Response regulator transcription factor n=1 Tax=Paenalkalicoccus suaedae TaxID=2592382 RepID=A0A859FBC0_9BACI|nr:response regulator transcription factor [Paenalkalicoccus suaedae]QKS70118.1 response regulator transcription factor [Paenalkalicoccus suaedae]